MPQVLPSRFMNHFLISLSQRGRDSGVNIGGDSSLGFLVQLVNWRHFTGLARFFMSAIMVAT